MSNALDFAKRELDILIKTNTDPENRPIIEKFIPEILALIDKFGKSGQSGGSAPYTASAISETIKKLCLFEPIAPITGDDSEWCEVTQLNDGIPMFQNRRCGALFKNGKDGDAYYIDAIVKKTQNGSCWSGSFWKSKNDYLIGNRELMIDKRAYVKSFPFTPKTFYIDVIEEEVAKDDWEMYLKDEQQLEKVFEYYKPKPITRAVIIEKQ